ncbi:hypothetical protein DPEC_G00192650 [Dallia pectoralis]|uniref:Uncharacterized protein n=1 Tax=Dallia pectoralis TaxID=75939 RepID=A0ACC2GCA0_DALPE|nr:hypothetical protein DPEC_G00192650 [Dallia pectoralis]
MVAAIRLTRYEHMNCVAHMVQRSVTMEACGEDHAYVVRFKTKFKEDLASRQEKLNNAWLQIATVLDPRFKDLKCLPKTDREEVWTTLEGVAATRISQKVFTDT